MVGSALVRKFQREGFSNLVVASHQELDLLDQLAVQNFFRQNKPTYVILAAAKVGGIQANIDAPTEFLVDNLKIQNNVIMAAFEQKVRKFCLLGSSCIYPKDCVQPMKEESLLTGPLEPTNEGYALAKITGLRLLQYLHRQYGFNGINPMPCNLYGKNDSFDLKHSHVLSALVRRFSDAVVNRQSEITLWGTGIARREFMNVDDIADAVFFLMKGYDSPDVINVGWGEDLSIRELAESIGSEVGYRGKVLWDETKPNGMLRKCLDTSRLKQLGFQPKISLSEGIKMMIQEYSEYRKEGGL